MKKSERKKLYLGLFIIFIMVFSTLGFILSFDGNTGTSNSRRINGYDFVLTNQGWVTQINNNYWAFNYLPDELDFDSNVGTITNKVFIVIDDNKLFSDISVKFALLGVIIDRLSIGEVDCNSGITTLIFKDGTINNKIYKENDCVYLEGDTIKSIDSLFYSILGIK